jgi:hypothetical protein
MPKYFTVDEANALVPRLTEILQEMRARLRELEPKRRELEAAGRRARGNGHNPESETIAAEVERLRRELQAGLNQINELGVEVKDLQQGLLDFPALREGRQICLCWRLGEPSVAFWHDLDTGFAGRQPL